MSHSKPLIFEDIKRFESVLENKRAQLYEIESIVQRLKTAFQSLSIKVKGLRTSFSQTFAYDNNSK